MRGKIERGGEPGDVEPAVFVDGHGIDAVIQRTANKGGAN
jgi:hypothetical protein